jgi:hypothetical protein
MATAKVAETVNVTALSHRVIRVRLIGTTPLYYNAMSAKAMRDLLIGGGKKTAAERKDIKHDPEREFRDSVYKIGDGPTLLSFPSPGLKGAMATAALETKGGVTKTSVKRLIYMPQYHVTIWGKPLLKMDVVRSADMNRTPDIRTRAFLPEWASEVEIAFVSPTLAAQTIVAMLQNAGLVVGIGDFRQEKGSGNFGLFRVVSAENMSNEDQTDWDRITKQDKVIQRDALDNPEPADPTTQQLLTALRDERSRRAA